MKKKAEILSLYKNIVNRAGKTVVQDIRTWDKRAELFAEVYIIGWVLDIADVDTDENISDSVNFYRKLIENGMMNANLEPCCNGKPLGGSDKGAKK